MFNIKIAGREQVLKYAEAAFPNLDELLTFRACLIQNQTSPDYMEISSESAKIKNSENWLGEITRIAREIISSGKGPEYFLVTVAEKGVVYVDAEDVEHYNLDESVNWEQVPDSGPVENLKVLL